MPSTAAPDPTCKGLTFLPVPEFSDLECAFGAPLHSFFRRKDRPAVPGEFLDEAARLCHRGGALPAFGGDVEAGKADRAIGAWKRSLAPSYEGKVATIAYALWVWSPAAAQARSAQVEAA